MACSDSQIDKPQHGHPKRAELPDVNINTGAQSINTESFFNGRINLFIKTMEHNTVESQAVLTSFQCLNFDTPLGAFSFPGVPPDSDMILRECLESS